MANCYCGAILAKIITKSVTMALHSFRNAVASTHPMLPPDASVPLE